MSKKKKRPKSPDIRVLQLKNAVALELDAIIELFDRAFEGHTWMEGKQMRKVLATVNDFEKAGVFLARVDERWAGMGIIIAPTTAIFPWPMVVWVYGRGEVRDRVCAAIRDWARGLGSDQIIGGNYNVKRSRAFVKVFGKMFRGAKVVGDIVAFDCREE